MERQIIAGLFLVLLVGLVVPNVHAIEGSDDAVTNNTVVTANTSATAGTPIQTRGDLRRGIEREWRNGSQQIIQERKEGFNDLRERMMNATGNGTNLTKEQIEKFREERKEILENVKAERETLREQTKAAIEQARETLKQQRERIEELRGQYTQKRDDFRDARGNAEKVCKGSQKTEACKQARQQLNGHAKEFMGNAAEEMVRIIDAMETRVGTNPYVENQTRNDVLDRLDAHKVAITEAQAKVNELSNSSDVNATKQAAEELRAAWMDARVTIRLSEGLLEHARFNEFLAHLDTMEARFKEARDEAASNGTDVTQLDADIASFSAKVSAAHADYDKVEASYVAAMDNAKTEAEANALLKSTRDQLKATRDGLQGARDDLRNIIKDFRTVGGEKLSSIAAKIKADSEQNASLEVEE